MTIVRLRHVTKAFPPLFRRRPVPEVLRGVNLCLDQPGSVVAVSGPNGSGKTTLLKILATLLRPDRGEVTLFDLDATRHGAAARRRLGFVGADSGSFYWRLSAAANLEFFGGVRGLGGASLGRRIHRLLDELGFSAELCRSPFWTLSTGYRRRLAIARGLLHRPSLLLLDEPLSGLDPAGRDALDAAIRRLADDNGNVVAVTQDRGWAGSIADAGYRLCGGRVVAEDDR